MTLVVQNGYVQVTDIGGHVVHDTRDQIFHVLTELSGSVSVGGLGWGGSGSGVTRANDWDLGAVDAAATALMGICKVTYSGGLSSLPSGLWYTVGGSIILNHKTFQTISGTWSTYCSTASVFSFVLASGRARCQEETVNRDDYLSGTGATASGWTLQYKLYAGAFT